MGFIFRSSTHNYACVAQLVEQLTLNQWVRGSNPRARTINKTASFNGGCFINENEDRTCERYKSNAPAHPIFVHTASFNGGCFINGNKDRA